MRGRVESDAAAGIIEYPPRSSAKPQNSFALSGSICLSASAWGNLDYSNEGSETNETDE
jgi:hypothetical protein